MNTQPNPTGEPCPNCGWWINHDQPKPTDAVQEARIRIVNYLGDRLKSPIRRYEEDEIERIINAALAAEREKVQTLVDALKRLNERKWYDGTGEIIKDALAEVEEGTSGG